MRPYGVVKILVNKEHKNTTSGDILHYKLKVVEWTIDLWITTT
jgi:hypothetical protein